MPHQCLQCGHAFADGSSVLLSGCPQCKGTRFFYTENELGDAERQKIQGEAKADLKQVVAEMLQGAAPEAAKELQGKAGSDGWAELKPRDLRRLVKQVQAESGGDIPAARSGLAPGHNLTRSDHAVRRAEAAAAAKEMLRDEEILAREEATPDTVNIREAGNYEVDLKGLLEKDPIVVQRDGAYMIHLPSLFGKNDE